MEKYVSNSGQEFVILKKLDGRKVLIQFTSSGSIREVFEANALAGKVKDLYSITCYGRGWLGEYRHCPYWKPALQLWRNMMKRCYSEVDDRGYLFKKGTTVDPSWHAFEKFLEDIKELPNFTKWLSGGDCTKTKYTLDKDLICPEANTYSKHTCSFVSEHDNKSAGAKVARATDKRYENKRSGKSLTTSS